MLKLVIPKGSLEEQTLRLFEAADLTVRRSSSRDYHGSDRRRAHRARQRAAPPGDPDLRGRRACSTSASPDRTGSPRPAATSRCSRVSATRRRGTGHGTKIVLAVPNEHPANSAKEMPAGSRISTEFVRDHRAAFRGSRHPGQGRVELRRHRGEGARDRRCDRRCHRDGQHPARARHEDHRDAAHERPCAGREPGGGGRPGEAGGDGRHHDPAARRARRRRPRADQAERHRGPPATRCSRSSRR